ncbi:MAG: aminopeptidase N, partial [Bacteroidetes bacterium]
HVNQTYPGLLGNIPVMLTAVPGDTTNMKNSFQHLDEAFTGFETRYGPYRWDRVGFCLVPFGSGAMEPATNISYPRTAANGTLTYEASLMAHEFAHHWWGDLATCRTQEDMWLNEGWATYSQYVFSEWYYGRAAYLNSVRSNHEDMVHNVHLTENGYRAVSGVPHQYTYSDHVYVKGADVAHTLRGYMGDSLFWLGLQYHLNQSQFTDVSSADFRDNLVTASGLTNLNDFFNDWVFNGGWPHFSIDSFSVVPNSPNYDITLYMKQKLDGAPNYYTNVPLDITFRDAGWNTAVRQVMVSGQNTTATVSIPFNPDYAAVDFDEKISDAIADEWRVISAPGTFNMNLARCTLNVVNITDSVLFRVEHNFAPPDSIVNNTNNYRISDYRYWNIDGLFPSTFYATGRFYYDGRNGSGYTGNLDNGLTVPNGDSIILLYRRNAGDNWQEYPHYTKTIIGAQATSKYGYVVADSLQPGQYAFANGVSTVLNGMNETRMEDYRLAVFPNPAGDEITLSWENLVYADARISIYDLHGKLLKQNGCQANQTTVDVSGLPAGMYFAEVWTGETMLKQKFIKK